MNSKGTDERLRVRRSPRVDDISESYRWTNWGALGQFTQGDGFPKKHQGDGSGEYPFYKVGDMNKPGNERYLNNADNYVNEDVVSELGASIVPPRSVVFPKVGEALLTNKRRVTTEKCLVDNNLVAFKPSSLSADYLYWVLQAVDLKPFTAPGPVPSIPKSTLSQIRLPIPGPETRDNICSYLEVKIPQIHDAKNAYRSFLSHIQELRKKKIQSAVSGSTISRTRLTDSGIGWIGDIPNHWDVVRTRFVAELHSGHTPDRSNDEYWEDTDIPWVSLADSDRIRHNDSISETAKYTNEKGLANSSAHLLPEGTVVFTRDATVGLCSILERPMAVSQHLVGWVCGPRILPEYLLNVLKSMDQEYDRLTRGSTISTIGMHDIEGFKTPLPPLEEQREIVDHIETETERLWELIDRVEETIDLLEEKRQALITAAVTGQIDVPDIVANE